MDEFSLRDRFQSMSYGVGNASGNRLKLPAFAAALMSLPVYLASPDLALCYAATPVNN
jgi:hypothetical protein